MKIIKNPIDLSEENLTIPAGFDLVVHDKSHSDFQAASKGIVLYGFDEIGDYSHEFPNPTYSLIKIEASQK
jgi:hypothetical protein